MTSVVNIAVKQKVKKAEMHTDTGVYLLQMPISYWR